ncbi:hypothetical protein LA080_000803 [Diaporthe eres]|uniref:Azaphilone pigments biosynthesis cluster protein L N-terminal domain-containing protein n=1 Tax=Diaporthe vaccinii TaxID=105482 RepID=A0ABR4EER8_9PEZI|nr:hypothetical protein LA080_000803 [Diaporthe eres]
MDPLSITTSAITLIQAAGSITSSLCGFVNQCRGAETRITGLCEELESLTSGLEAIGRTLKGRNALDLAPVEDDLWKQCELALVDCHVTLNSLGVLVQKIKETVRPKAWAWRVKAVVNLNVYGGDLAAFRDKVHKSNWALQTMLQTINVSLSLRNHASQEAILIELDHLKASIEASLIASIRPVGGFTHRPADHSDTRVARNLRNLAQAARNFHGAASSTASTIRDGSRGGAPWQAYPGADIDVSLMGDLPSFRRERVEEYVREGRRHRRSRSLGLTSPSFSPSEDHTPRLRRASRSPRRSAAIHSPRTLSFSGTAEAVTVPASVTVATVEEDEDEDDEIERLFLDGLEELAKDRIKERDFDKAIEFLQEAMKREVGSKSDNEGFCNLQVQLALCYLLQRRWEMAEPIITGLAKNKAAMDVVVCNLLHSMALVHLSLYLFDKALTVCREALLAKKKLLKREKIHAEDYAQTQGLLVMIYEMKGDWMHAEVYQSQIPACFNYKHPKNEVEFIIAHPNLLSTILGDDLPDFSIPQPKVTPGLYELYGSGPDDSPASESAPPLRRNHTYNGASPLKVKFTQQLRYEADTSKIVYVPESAPTAENSPATSSEPSTSGDADDEASPTTTSPEPESPVRRRLSRMLGGTKAQAPQPAKVSTPPQDDSAEVPVQTLSKPAPKHRWVSAMRGFKKPRNLLRKASHDDVSSDDALGGLGGKPNEFQLLFMGHMTPENADQMKDPTYRRKYWSPESIGRGDANTQEMNSGSDDESSDGGRKCTMTLPKDNAEDGNFTFKNGVPYVDVKGLRRPRPHLEDVQEQEEHDEEDNTAPETTKPQTLVELSADSVEHFELPMLFDPYLCRTETEVKEYWDTAMRARPSGVKACDSQHESLFPAEMDISVNEARVLLKMEEQTRALTSPKTSIAATSAPEKHSPGRKRCNRIVTHPVDPLLQSISSVLASLGDISDAEGRHAVKLDLEIMALQFKTRFRDGLVNQDLQRAIASLEDDAVRLPRNETDDSGYESMGSDKEKKAEEEKPKPTTKRAAAPKVTSPFADYTRALHDRTEKPRMRWNLATEPCKSSAQPSRDETSHQRKQSQEARLPLRKRFSFEQGEDEVVDPSHAVAALQALVESGEADAIRSAIVPSVHTRFGLHQKLERRSSVDGSEVRIKAAESPHAPAKHNQPKSAVEEEVELCPEDNAVVGGEVTVQSPHDLGQHHTRPVAAA